jgi:DNA-binding transcriptional ArsR family regulator
LYEEPKAFTTLLNTIDLSRSTLSIHLKQLQEAGVIEKAIKNNEVVYQTIPNEEKWLSEIKRMSFDYALAYLCAINPEMGFFVQVMSKLLVRIAVTKRNKMIELGRELSNDEVVMLGREVVHQMVNEYTELSKDPMKFGEEVLPVSLDKFAKIMEAGQMLLTEMRKVEKK